MALEKEQLIDLYKTMVRIRYFDERANTEFKAARIPGNVHQYVGQEAIAAGACAALRPDDYIASNHRGHGHAIAKGVSIDRMMAELFGRSTGTNRGRVGSMHIADWDAGHLGAQPIVGDGIPIATGAALALKMKGTDRVVLCFFGDGATNTGRFHEGVNLGAIWKLPVIYIIENNGWGMNVSVEHSCNLTNLADRAVAYGIPGVIVDGNDPIAVYETVSEAVARARKGEGPTLVECKTFRLLGHHSTDAQQYRPKEDIEESWRKEPIKRFRERLVKMGILTEKQAEQINAEILGEIDRAVKFAEESPPPMPTEVWENIYT